MRTSSSRSWKSTRRSLLRGAGTALAAPWFYVKAARAADPKRLTAYNYDGVVGKFYYDHWMTPFAEKYDIKFDIVPLSGSLVPLDKLMAQIAAGRPEADYVPLTPPQMIIANRNNALLKYGIERMPEGANWDPDYLTPYGPKTVPYAYGLAYDPKKIEKPTSWQSMWSPAMRKQVSINDTVIEDALQMVNLAFTKNLLPVNADTFRHLDALRPNLVTMWTTGAQVEQLFRTGEIALSPCWNGRIYGLKDQGVSVDFTVPDEGFIVRWGLLGVARNAQNPDLAVKFVDYTMGVEPQQKLIDLLSYASPNRKCTYTDEALRRTVLRVPANIARAKFEDFEVIVDKQDEWTKQWAQWKAS